MSTRRLCFNHRVESRKCPDGGILYWRHGRRSTWKVALPADVSESGLGMLAPGAEQPAVGSRVLARRDRRAAPRQYVIIRARAHGDRMAMIGCSLESDSRRPAAAFISAP